MHGLIALDWGTSSLRAYWMDGAGSIRESRARPWGIRQLPAGGFDAALGDITAGWPALPRLACGMVGSRNGWLELPYLDLPATPPQLAASLRALRAGDGRDLHIVPGLRNPRRPDVMRGEETQLVGALAIHPELAGGSRWVLPGTHSKWVSVQAGAVLDFCTLMTGEMFGLLREHSILCAGSDAGTADPKAFGQGVAAARDSGSAGALSRLFSARALMLEGALAPASVPEYLSGLMLGEELRSQLAGGTFDADEPIRLIGDAALCARYREAAAHFGMTLAAPLADTAAHGLWRLAALAGLVASGAARTAGATS